MAISVTLGRHICKVLGFSWLCRPGGERIEDLGLRAAHFSGKRVAGTRAAASVTSFRLTPDAAWLVWNGPVRHPSPRRSRDGRPRRHGGHAGGGVVPELSSVARLDRDKKEEGMNTSFRVRVGSRSERLSTEFALAILPHLQRATGHRLAPIQITPEPYVDGCPFSDVRSWDWPSSSERLRELAKGGLNLLILSERSLDWDTPAEVMNDDLHRFEDDLARLGLVVISIETYSENHLPGMLSRFRGVPEWFGAGIEEVLVEMLEGYSHESLSLPYGGLPYFLLDPQQASLPLPDDHLQAFVGFQLCQYERALRRWPIAQFPMENVLAGINGQLFPKTGAIPVDLKMPL